MNTTITPPLHQQLRALRRQQRLILDRIARQIGASPAAVGDWERGDKSPRIHHAVAHARTLGRRIIITLNDTHMCDLQDVLPDLARFRQAQGVSGYELASLLFMNRAAVCATERRASSGAHLSLATVEIYLNGLGYKIELAQAVTS